MCCGWRRHHRLLCSLLLCQIKILLRLRSMSTNVFKCGFLGRQWWRGSVFRGAVVKHAHLQNFHTLIYKCTLPQQRQRLSTSSCSCRVGWRSGRTRSGRWWAELPSKARGCWRGWCRSTWPSWCWSREGRSLLFPQQRSCWHGGRPPREGIGVTIGFGYWFGFARQ